MSTGALESVPGLDVRLDGDVLRLELNRPEKQNALTDEVLTQLVRCLETVQAGESGRAVLLTAAGEHFCGGFDILARNVPRDERPITGSVQRRLSVTANRLISLVLSTQVPIVSAVRGWVVGIGLHLAVAADFCVAANDARFWSPFVTRGFTPDSGATWLVPRLVGVAKAKEILMLGRRISGEEAAAIGLVHRAVEPAALDETAEALVAELAAGPTVALGLTKWLVHTGTGLELERHLHNEAFAMELSSRSPDFREGMSAYRDRRSPDFTGR